MMKAILERLVKLAELKKTVSDSEKRMIRGAFKQFDSEGRDALENQKTVTPGVSDVGIEVRRADAKVPGVIAHGYGRVSDPERHAAKAKSIHRGLLNHLKNMAKPNLPKSEAKDIAPRIGNQPMIQNAPLTTTQPEFVNSPVVIEAKDKK
jgi:hypothetical protein